nr:type IV secretion system protein [Escherichia coli]
MNYEAYDWQTIQEQADTVKTMSSQKVFSAYDTMIRADSSPLNILKNNYKIKVQINSVILLRKDMAQVRFKKMVLDLSGKPAPDTEQQSGFRRFLLTGIKISKQKKSAL